MSSNLRADDAVEFNRPCDALPVAIERASTLILARITLITNELK